MPTAQSSPSSPTRSLNRQILSLAVPALGALIAEPLFVLIDSSMVGHLGSTALAGLSLASSLLTTVVGLFIFLAYATTATTARLFGAGRRREGLAAGIDGMWLALLIGLVAFAFLWLAAPTLATLMGAHGAVHGEAAAYLRASAPGLPGMLVVYAATGTLRGLLDTRTPFVVATAGAGVNVALNAMFMYGFHMGIAGSGVGTALTQTLMAVALSYPVLREARRTRVRIRPRRSGLTASLGAGTPLLIRTLSLRAALLVTVWTATSLGKDPLAAHQVVNSLWTFAAFALDALAIAAQALVGTALGAQDSGEVAGRENPGVDAVLRRCLAWGIGAGAVIGLALAALSSLLPHLFTSDQAVIDLARPCLLIAACAMPLAGAVYLFDGVLMGAGDGVFLAWAGLATLIPYVPAALAVASIFGISDAGAGLAWLWLAFSGLFMGMRALTTGLRARSEAWRH